MNESAAHETILALQLAYIKTTSLYRVIVLSLQSNSYLVGILPSCPLRLALLLEQASFLMRNWAEDDVCNLFNLIPSSGGSNFDTFLPGIKRR